MIDNLEFSWLNELGLEMDCDIVAIIPNPTEKENPYIIFTDYTLDEEDNVKYQYAKVGVQDSKYILEKIDDLAKIEELNMLLKEQE